MLSEKALVEAGYRKYIQDPKVIRNADYILQKRFWDEKGVRYFVTVFVYDWQSRKIAEPGLLFPDFGFSPTVQFGEEGVAPTVDVSLHDSPDITVDSVEAYFEKMWSFLGEPYYERED